MRVYANNIFTICLVVSISFSIATQMIVAQLYGAKQLRRAHLELTHSVKISCLIIGALSILFWLNADSLIRYLSENDNVIEMAATVFMIYFLTEIPRTINIVVTGSLKAVGDAWVITFRSCIITWIIALPSAFLLTLYFELGLLGILWAIFLDELLRSIANLSRWYSKHAGLQGGFFSVMRTELMRLVLPRNKKQMLSGEGGG
jgi:Na+-driven multidrug efflux pump